MVRGYMIMNAIAIVVPAAIWIASIQVDYPNRIALIWIAIFVGKSYAHDWGARVIVANCE